MTKRSKRILFYSAVLVFLLLSYVVIFYAEGYKYSFSKNKFVRTGAISMKVNTSASIYLDRHLEGNTSFFGDSFSINGLLPGQYKIAIQKEGYYTWQKTIIVEEGFVVDFSKILILPQKGEDKDVLYEEIQNLFKAVMASPSPSSTPKPTTKQTLKSSPQVSPTFAEIYTEPFILENYILYKNNNKQLDKIASNVKGFSLSRYNNKLLWWTTDNELWVMWLNDTNYQPFNKNGDMDIITKLSYKIKNAAWFRDEDHIVIDANDYKIIEIDKRGGLNIIDL